MPIVLSEEQLLQITDPEEVPLLERYRIFADEYLTGAVSGKPFNLAAAYEVAGYSVNTDNPSANAYKVKNHPHVQRYIKLRMEELHMGADELLARFTAIARNEAGDVVTVNEHGHLTIDPVQVMLKRKMIKSFSKDSNGNPKIVFHDAVDAMKEIARLLGLYKDGLDITSGGAPMAVNVMFVNPDGQTVSPDRLLRDPNNIEVEDD